MDGIIKKLHTDKGFGFILASNGREFFFHRSSLQNQDFAQLQQGDSVEFEEGDGPKGPRAEKVRVL